MRKALPGQPLRIPASTFNTVLDAAAAHQRRAFDGGSDVLPRDTRNGIITVRNDSGADRDVFSVLAVSGVLVTPGQNAQEFATRWACSAVLPAAGNLERFVVLQEPLRSGVMGRAVIIGVTPVWLKRPTGNTAQTAGAVAGQVYLDTSAAGAQIVWEGSFSGENLHPALVRLPYLTEQPLVRMRVTSVLGDYLVCQRWTGSAWSTTNENVAKPYLLRTSITSRNGITYTYANGWTRTATQGASTETQVIVPSYYTSGDQLFAAVLPSTGVVVGGQELKLLDINADGRAWAKQ